MNNIILIGMPGSGKSTVGVLVAKMAGMDFIDSDLLIQKAEGKRLFELIDENGADGFLEIENLVNKSIETENSVIATGGSAVYCSEAMEHLRSIGTVIYIKVPLPEIKRRIGDFSTRGIVMKNGSTIEDLFYERVPLYEKYADITVETDHSDLRENAEKIINTINSRIVKFP